MYGVSHSRAPWRALLALCGLLFWQAATAAPAAHQQVTFGTPDHGVVDGSLFPAGNDGLAVVFAHGAAYTKLSWYGLAARLQQVGITSLAINFRGYGGSHAASNAGRYNDVLAAVTYLEQKGYQRIALVGASMGGTAVLQALADNDDDAITKVVLLAPAGGSGLDSPSVDKLFVVSAADPLRSTVQSLFDDSVEPKTLEVVPGSAHAQHMFDGPAGAGIEKRVIDFLQQEE